MKVEARDLTTGRPVHAELLDADAPRPPRAPRRPPREQRRPVPPAPTPVPREFQAAAQVCRFLMTRYRVRRGDLRLVLEDLGQELVNALVR